MITLKHKRLKVWQVSIDFTTRLYLISQDFPKFELYSLTNQIRRAAVSVSSNIAAGAARTGAKDRKHFYVMPRSSLVEIDTQLEIAKLLNYLNENQIKELEESINKLFALLSGLIKSTV